jgi:hypothetical protein
MEEVMTLEQMTREVVQDIGCEACHTYGDDERLVAAIMDVARKFAEKVGTEMGYAMCKFEAATFDRCDVLDAIAAAENDKP